MKAPNMVKLLLLPLLLLAAACQDQIDPREAVYQWPDPDPTSPMIGTKWAWDSGWEPAPRIILFQDSETLLYTDSDHTEPCTYLYDPDGRKGRNVTFGNDFTVNGDYTLLHFVTWRNYGHSAEFTRGRD